MLLYPEIQLNDVEWKVITNNHVNLQLVKRHYPKANGIILQKDLSMKNTLMRKSKKQDVK